MGDFRDRRPGRLSLYVKRALLTLFAFAASALVCEGLLRVFWDNPYHLRAQHERVVPLRMHVPLNEVVIDRSAVYPDSPTVWMRFDERGYILPTRRFSNPDATILFLGGSTTECAAVDEELRFPALVSELLEERHGLRVTALNAGVAGSTLHDSLNVLLNHAVADRPDVAILMHANNDVGMLARRGRYPLAVPISFRTPLLWSLREASAYSSLAAAVRIWLRRDRVTPLPFEVLAEWEPDRAGIDSDEFVARLRAYLGVARAFGIEPLLMTQPVISVETSLTPEWTDPVNQEIFNQEIRRVAAEEDAVLVDLARYLFERVKGWDQPMEIFYDGVHVTNAGSRVYAEHIVERLAQTVFAQKLAAKGSDGASRPSPPDSDE